MSVQTVELQCPSCQVTQPAERDECGASLDLVPCEGSNVKHMLCQFCRILCAHCDQFCCEDHSVEVPLPVEKRVLPWRKTERVCRVCMAENLVRG